ncbi:hypothetical protein GCM10010912_44430 [Paenibacillus albidus]|uniref:Bacteriocin n=1 Tax=Paenibacillus albidus TaxID=2041023 RepID=A0A917CR16_9BACL|nr:hypothetical protein GCM10010912_44430 [Paenibacillus albidus]
MKKLNKKNHEQRYTIEAYACSCLCWCAVCKCGNWLSWGDGDSSSNGHNYPSNAAY